MQGEFQWLYQSNSLPKIEGKCARLKEDYCFLIEFGVQKLTLNIRWDCTSNCTLFYYEDWRAERYTEMQTRRLVLIADATHYYTDSDSVSKTL